MSDLNLLRYYARLTPMGVGEAIKTSLPDISDSLFTSLRHARSLLAQMQEAGWLLWQPKVGRNQRSTLLLNRDLGDLKQELAAERIREGKYEKARAILDDDNLAFSRLLQNTSGASMREGRLHIQLTYKRPFERLVPHQIQRSSERFFLRQIYCCLVSSDREGHLKPELAHHWHYDADNLQWTFYLRPGLVFHNGTPIDADTIATLFTRLSSLTEYQTEMAHVISVSAPQPQTVVFTLSEPDLGFGGMISGVRYSIQPPGQVNHAQTPAVVGCGPFEVIEHTATQLRLQAFDRYYGCRALTDQVTIWLIDEQDQRQPHIRTNHPDIPYPNANIPPAETCKELEGTAPIGMPGSLDSTSGNTTKNTTQPWADSANSEAACNYYLAPKLSDPTCEENLHSQVEDGCMFILFNQQSAHALTSAQRRYLSSFLSADKLAEHLNQRGAQFGSVLAGNLLSHWHVITRPQAPFSKLPKQLSIAVYDYTALKNCAYGIQALLEPEGIRVKVNVYAYRDLIERCQQHLLTEDMVVTNINLDDNRHASAFSNLFNNAVLHHCIGEQASQWFQHSLRQLRASTPLEHYLDALEPIASTLITEYWLTPLFHHRQTLRFKGVLKDVELTNWGWPDIKNVWSTSE
ncbi:SgrR family transcriptional regulator [Photobacterium sp. GSS17]|uniref:SgrR family transcriptional regulator n=1 Tax=Photobacterium sp. GSS17 TaxID=3020715 RepID=UPI002360312C|nr:SgrR family transcriptional regulator [Photobacterium sp. GSS17]